MEQVQEAFGETMTSVVSLCARYPIACANSIGLLCTIPYTRQVLHHRSLTPDNSVNLLCEIKIKMLFVFYL